MRQMENELPRQERLEKLFDDLVKHIEIDAALLREYAEEVCDIYSDLEFRHSYSEISLVLEKYRQIREILFPSTFYLFGKLRGQFWKRKRNLHNIVQK